MADMQHVPLESAPSLVEVGRQRREKAQARRARRQDERALARELRRPSEDALRAWVDKGLTDREIASRLGVSISTVQAARQRYGIPRSDKFARHFCAKYGPDALDRFRALAAAHATLGEIAARFGFSKAYAGSIYHTIVGHPPGRKGAPREGKIPSEARRQDGA